MTTLRFEIARRGDDTSLQFAGGRIRIANDLVLANSSTLPEPRLSEAISMTVHGTTEILRTRP
jgi:hypothetical protein